MKRQSSGIMILALLLIFSAIVPTSGKSAESHNEKFQHERIIIPGAGSAIDVGSFRYWRKITAGKTGLNTLLLDAAVLSHSKMSDLRIADLEGRQIPYLIERADEPLSLDLPKLEKIKAPESKESGWRLGTGGRSCYSLRLPYENLPAARLVLMTTAHVFNRNLYILIEKNPLKERQEPWTERVADAMWSHDDPEIPAPELILNIPPLKTAEVMLVVEEGDNSPLPIGSAELLLPCYRLRFFRETDEDLKLCYGRSDLEAPRYDLAILAPRLEGVAAEEVSMGPENEAAPLKSKQLPASLFWGILIAAVLILLILITRLVR
jgi:hypothetical protein